MPSSVSVVPCAYGPKHADQCTLQRRTTLPSGVAARHLLQLCTCPCPQALRRGTGCCCAAVVPRWLLLCTCSRPQALWRRTGCCSAAVAPRWLLLCTYSCPEALRRDTRCCLTPEGCIGSSLASCCIDGVPKPGALHDDIAAGAVPKKLTPSGEISVLITNSTYRYSLAKTWEYCICRSAMLLPSRGQLQGLVRWPSAHVLFASVGRC